MNSYKSACLFIFCLMMNFCFSQDRLFTSESILMGCGFQFCIVENEKSNAHALLKAGEAEVVRIENLISSWNPNSQTSAINRNAGISPIKVDTELINLIKRCKKISILTKGAFDITFSYCGLWNFDQSEQEIPDSSEVKRCTEHVDWKKVIVNDKLSTVYLLDKGMQISFGAIGKGYAANRASLKMKEAGAKSGLVNASGDMICWGLNEHEKKWPIAISNPDFPYRGQAFLAATDMAVVTSGDYEKFFTHFGIRYSHIINPKTGWPATEIKSVSVFCPDAELGDALSTSIFVLGVEKGLALANSLLAVECFIIDSEGNKFYSDGLLD